MLLTEDEARTKWCPHVREPMLDDPGDTVVCVSNRNADGSTTDVQGLCIASDCSQWRWMTTEVGRNATQGYCGLAGRPTD